MNRIMNTIEIAENVKNEQLVRVVHGRRKQIGCQSPSEDMSDHRSCILQRESPPSLELSDGRPDDSLSESYPSVPISPSSPLDFDDCDTPPPNVTSEDYAKREADERKSRTISNNEPSNVDNITKHTDDSLIISSSSNNDDVDSKTTTVQSSMNLPKLISTLTLTDDHPLMMLSSPDSPPSAGNYPDLILPSCKSKDGSTRSDLKPNTCESNHFLGSDNSGMMSLSSTEEDSFNRSLANGDVNSLHSESFSVQYGPQRNTSKNNLYFSENFANDTCKNLDEHDNINKCSNIEFSKTNLEKSSSIQPDILDSGNIRNNKNTSNVNPVGPPDLTVERKKIKPDVRAPKLNSSNSLYKKSTNTTYKILGREIHIDAMGRHIPVNTVSTQMTSDAVVSPSQSKSDLSIDLPSDLSTTDDIPSPDSSTASHPENERSLYLAEVDAVGGCVLLKPREPAPIMATPKKRIKPLPTETDTESTVLSNPTLFVSCQNEISGSTSSIDSLSDCSLHSDNVFLQDQATSAASNVLNSKPSAILKQITDLKLNDDDECSDTETETECPLRNKLSSKEFESMTEKIPEYSLSEERQDTRRWLSVTLPSGEKRTIDMKVIEPYKRVLSHGGYALSGRRDAIVVFSACYLPDSSRVDYNYVMDNLFLYVLTTLEQLVTDDYILVYLHGSASKRSMPTFHWLKKCYQLIDRRLRKSLKHLYLVHPTFWLKSIMWMTRPFISTKFSRKLSYVHTLEELEGLVPVEYAAIPEKVRRYDSRRTSSV